MEAVDVIVFAEPLEVVVVGVEYFHDVLVLEELVEKELYFVVDSAELVNQENSFHGCNLDQADE